MLRKIVLVMCLAAAPALVADVGKAGRYLGTQDYLQRAFPDAVPAAATLWIKGELRTAVERAIGHRFGSLRVRYWYNGRTSAWILDEIGKEQPITIGVTVTDDAIAAIRILEFRESRGWEVRYPFFTDQFRDARLADSGQLDRNIDGITGATLSVTAVKRMARVALILHAKIKQTS